MIDWDMIFVTIILMGVWYSTVVYCENMELRAMVFAKEVAQGEPQEYPQEYHPVDATHRATQAANTMDALMWYDL
jgi:hypothetical protein